MSNLAQHNTKKGKKITPFLSPNFRSSNLTVLYFWVPFSSFWHAWPCLRQDRHEKGVQAYCFPEKVTQTLFQACRKGMALAVGFALCAVWPQKSAWKNTAFPLNLGVPTSRRYFLVSFLSFWHAWPCMRQDRQDRHEKGVQARCFLKRSFLHFFRHAL